MSRVRWRKVLKLGLLIIPAVLILAVGYDFVFPDVSRLKSQAPEETAFMKYRRETRAKQGKDLALRYTWVPLGQISSYLVHAVVIAEDDKFWDHKGFDLAAIKLALEKDIKRKTWRYGGSTITQQLAKNLYLSPSRNPVRKLREFILAWRLERALSKKRILELYLNVVEWGDGIFGAEAAAEHYYGKPAAALDPAEAAHLAIVLPNPQRYNPLSGSDYIESRAAEVLEIMIKRGVAGGEEAQD